MKIFKRCIIGISVLFFSAISLNANSSAPRAQANASQKLTDTKLRICQNKESAIQKRSSQLSNLANNLFNKFNRIATQLENYYTNTVIPSGKSVSNYNALIAELTAKKNATQTDLAKAENDAAAFRCDSDDSKGQLALFRTDMQKVKQDLKDYRTTIKNLIVAIHSVTDSVKSSTYK